MRIKQQNVIAKLNVFYVYAEIVGLILIEKLNDLLKKMSQSD